MAERGKFIVLDGLEGTGKGTNLAFMETCLQGAGIPVEVTREPGGTPLAEQIRELLLAPRQETVDPIAELLLMFAARAQHLNQFVEPALAQGHWVLCDRFTDATYAYQGHGRGLPLNVIATLETLVQGERQPDKVFILDVPVEIGLARATQAGEADRFERENQRFFQRVREGYHERARAHPERYALIDASQPLQSVQDSIQAELEKIKP